MRNFLKHLDWNNDLGLSPLMIQDQARNQFYDTVFEQSVDGKNCIEIGFGTGILSMLALKHGANHITAFEKNPHNFQFGQCLIEKLGLGNKITLINQPYNHSHDMSDCVIFHEIIDHNIWGEQLLSCVGDAHMIPETYFCKFYVCKITQDEFIKFKNDQSKERKWQTFYQSVKDHAWPECSRQEFKNLPQQIQQSLIDKWHCAPARTTRWTKKLVDEYVFEQFKFVPGVDIDSKFVNEIQDSIANSMLSQRLTRLHDVDLTTFTNLDFQRLVDSGTVVAQYEVNVNTKLIMTRTNNTISTMPLMGATALDICLDQTLFADTVSIIIPVYGMQYDQQTLTISPTLENPHSHWSIPNGIKLCDHPISNIVIRNQLNDNQVKYYEE